ncbi:MAG: hypothetical protein WCT85_02035 [Parachlamydiales bacterium]
MANATVALNFLQESVQKYGFMYFSSVEGSGFAVTREAVCLISSVAIAAITAIGCCCTRLCTKPGNYYNLNTVPPMSTKQVIVEPPKEHGFWKYIPSFGTIQKPLLILSTMITIIGGVRKILTNKS